MRARGGRRSPERRAARRCARAVRALGRSRRAPAAGCGRDRGGRALVPLALAASLVLVVGGAFLYELTARSTRVHGRRAHRRSREVLSRHQQRARHAPRAAAVESSMASRFAWQMRLPEHPEQAGLELVGARPCLYGEGLVAHIMYRHNGHPVSVFMLPQKRAQRGADRGDGPPGGDLVGRRSHVRADRARAARRGRADDVVRARRAALMPT